MSVICTRELNDMSERGSWEDDTPPPGAWYPPCKVVADTIVAGVLLVLTAPIILFLMILVKATSHGPAIYKQRRLGRSGRPFEIYKLRTMTHDCERLTGPQWAKAGDSRVTPLGRFLRRSHLDELPQLCKVVGGDMSLIGPRPERPEFVTDLELVIPDYCQRMQVRPGITGLAQVQLPADEDIDGVRRKVRCDLYYIRRMDPYLDLKIMLGTLMKVMGLSFSQTRLLLRLPGVQTPERNLDVPATAGEAKVAQYHSL